MAVILEMMVLVTYLLNISFDNIIYESNHQNSDLYDLPFDGHKRLTTRRQIYSINDDTVFRLCNGSSVDVKMN